MRNTGNQVISSLFILLMITAPTLGAADSPRSHPSRRTAPPPLNRPLAQGPGFFVDARQGNDSQSGTAAAPWKTIRHALRQLKAGDTLYLKGGTYYENVYHALRGKADAPITIRSAPGEQAILDGSWREFYEAPADAWEPVPEAEGEFRSKRVYPNERDVIGSFGDSMIGLQTYHHAIDLRARGEKIEWENEKKMDQSDIKPLYCGPGMWYDASSGRIHARLGHTHNPDPMPNYSGETDPRKLPLIIASFNSVSLHVDGAAHVRFQDLIIRGGGYTTVVLNHVVGVEFDNVTIWCGTYGIRAGQTGPFTFHRSALHGNAAPWTFRSDTSKRDYPGRPHRNITRLNTHALIELDAGRESSVYATPQNDNWEFSYSEFTDAADGLYLGSINVKFHHNLVEDMQDDGIYLSPMYYRHRLDKKDPVIQIEQNLFRKMLTAIAFGGPETETRDQVLIYRNIFDLRERVATARPSSTRESPGFSFGKIIGDHGSPPWPAISAYQNTVIAVEPARDAAMSMLGASKIAQPRRVFNNIFYHFGRLPAYQGPTATSNAIEDGNLYWSVQAEPKVLANFFNRYRASPEFEQSKKHHPPGSSSQSLLVDPKFLKAETDSAAANDYRLGPDSPALNAGVPPPKDWPDPLRPANDGKPDIGALPSKSAPFLVGRKAAPK
ncbi:MAG: DUF1565 domain-containing protein [Planctomycetes bacterium]|nr:DUF1565 domain-containing protein [Planctomycetota bacterium]